MVDYEETTELLVRHVRNEAKMPRTMIIGTNKTGSSIESHRKYLHGAGNQSVRIITAIFLVLILSLLLACTERLGSRWAKFGRSYVIVPGAIQLWAHAVSLGFSSEIQFEHSPNWGDAASMLTPRHVDVFAGIGLASVSDDLGIPVGAWTQDYIEVNSGVSSTGWSKTVILRQTDPRHSQCKHSGLRYFATEAGNTPYVKFRYCSPLSRVYSSFGDIPPLARDLIKIDSEYGSPSAYQFNFDVTGTIWPDVEDEKRVRFNVSVFVEIRAKGVRADDDKFTTVESYNHSKLRAFRSTIARRVFSAYVAEWERRGVRVTFDDSTL